MMIGFTGACALLPRLELLTSYNFGDGLSASLTTGAATHADVMTDECLLCDSLRRSRQAMRIRRMIMLTPLPPAWLFYRRARRWRLPFLPFDAILALSKSAWLLQAR